MRVNESVEIMLSFKIYFMYLHFYEQDIQLSSPRRCSYLCSISRL